jgi:outer membrane protein
MGSAIWLPRAREARYPRHPSASSVRGGLAVAGAVLSSLCLAGSVCAAEPVAGDAAAATARLRPWFLRVDLAGILLSESAETTVAGGRIPGNTVSINDSLTVSLDLGYFVTENLAIAAIIGVPPRASLKGANALANVGVAATARYGPAALIVQYHPPPLLGVRTYLGIGISYTVFADVDGVALQNVKLPNVWGPAFQIGMDIPIRERWSLHMDAVQILASTRASGTYQGLPVSSNITVNPLILRLGVTWRF